MGLKETASNLAAFTISWLPISFGEIILYVITVAMIIIIVTLFHYTSVQMRVKKDSRCYRDKVLNRPGIGIYKASAYAASGEELYEISYDFGAKSYTILQKCTPGGVKNKVDIPVYNLGTRTEQIITKYFDCEKDFETTSKGLIYGGYPGIVKFMQYQNIEFFDRMVYGEEE